MSGKSTDNLKLLSVYCYLALYPVRQSKCIQLVSGCLPVLAGSMDGVLNREVTYFFVVVAVSVLPRIFAWQWVAMEICRYGNFISTRFPVLLGLSIYEALLASPAKVPTSQQCPRKCCTGNDCGTAPFKMHIITLVQK